MRLGLWIVAIWRVTASGAFAQSAGPGVVSGGVVDSSGGVVPGADVELFAASPAKRDRGRSRSFRSSVRSTSRSSTPSSGSMYRLAVYEN